MVVNKCCEVQGCYKIPTFRFFGGMPARCDTHLPPPSGRDGRSPPGSGPQAAVLVRIPKTIGCSQAAVLVRIPKTIGCSQAAVPVDVVQSAACAAKRHTTSPPPQPLVTAAHFKRPLCDHSSQKQSKTVSVTLRTASTVCAKVASVSHGKAVACQSSAKTAEEGDDYTSEDYMRLDAFLKYYNGGGGWLDAPCSMLDSSFKYTRVPQCETPGCSIKPLFALEGRCPTRCGMHRTDAHLPDPVLAAMRRNSKEQHVFDMIKNRLDPVLAARCPPIFNRYVGRRRPDVYFDLRSHVLIVEIDENQHHGCKKTDDDERNMDLFKDLGDRPLVMIRFNPDEYLRDGVSRMKSSFVRIGGIDRGFCVRDQIEWSARCDTLMDAIHEQLRLKIKENRTPDKALQVIKLFYNSYGDESIQSHS